MLVGQLFHVAVKTANLPATLDFYCRALGFMVVQRPAFNFDGAWLAPAVAGANAAVHVYTGDAARSPDGLILTGTAAIDHISFIAQGYMETRWQLQAFSLPYRENVAPRLSLWQLFVYDPNGVLLELTYHAAAERDETPSIEPSRQYRPRENFFAPEAYRQFGANTLEQRDAD